MATRYISTKVAVEGESEYRQAISTINTEIKALNSELRLVESEFQNHQNTLEALTKKSEALANLQKALTEKIDLMRQAYDGCRAAMSEYAAQKERLEAAIKSNAEKLERLKTAAGDTSEEEKKLTEEQRRLLDELDKTDQKFQAAEKGANAWTVQINNAQIQLNNLNATQELTTQYLDEASRSADGCAKSINEFGEKVDTSTTAVDELAKVLATQELAKAFREIKEVIEQCTAAASKFETGMAAVRRTVGGSDEYIRQLAENFKELATVVPITQEELTKIATLAGQLGVAQEDVESFTEIMARLGTATDLTAESAATLLAQFSNITGTRDWERLGSTVAALGDSTATTATKIVEMSQRMAASATIAGLSAKDILAISAAVGSLGEQSQAGGTAMQTLLTNIYKAVESGGKELDKFASISGMSGAEFVRVWRTEPIKAFDAFISGLNNVQRNGKSTIELLDDVGITNQRQIRAVMGLATAEGVLSDSVELANRAWEENTALTEKSETMYGTTESKLTMMKNSFGNLQIAVGEQLNPALAGLYEIGKGLADILTKIIEAFPVLVPLLAGLVTSFTIYTAAVAAITTVTKLWAIANEAVSISLGGIPIVAIVAGIGLLAGGIAALVANSQDAATEIDNLSNEIKDSEQEIYESSQTYFQTSEEINRQYEEALRYIAVLNMLSGELNGNADAQKQYAYAVAKLNEMFPDLRLEIDKTSGRITIATSSVSNYVDKWKEAKDEATKIENAHAVLEQAAKMEQSLSSLGKRWNEINTEIGFYESALKTLHEQYKNGEITADEYYTKTDEYAGAIRHLKDEQTDVEVAIDKGTRTLNKFSDEIKNAKETLGDFTDTVSDVPASFISTEEATTQAVDELSNRISALATSYADAKKSAENSVKKQMTLWEDMSEVGKKKIKDLQKVVDSQVKYLTDYNKNLENLRGRSIEGIEEFAKKFTDGSKESAAALAGLADASDTEIAKLINSFDKVDEEKGKMQKSFVEINTGYKEELQSIIDDYVETVSQLTGVAADEVDVQPIIFALEQGFTDAKVDLKEMGYDVGKEFNQGFEQGVSSGEAETESTAKRLGKIFIATLEAILDIHSPSKVTERIGKQTADGFIIGFDSEIRKTSESVDWLRSNLSSRMSRAAQSAVDSFKSRFDTLSNRAADTLSRAKTVIDRWNVNKEMRDSADGGVSAFASKFADLKSKVQTAINNVKNTIRNAGDSVYSAGEYLGDKFDAGMIKGLANRVSSVVAKAKSVVTQAVAAAYKAAGVNSPSKITTHMFEEVGQGMIVGLEHKEKDVVSKMRKVVTTTLDIDTAKLQEKMRISVPDIESKFERTISSNSTVRHTGTIRVEGVNDRGQLESVISVIVSDLRREARL